MSSDIRIVLVEPSHPGNIGATARAMKTMGFSDLWLVSPRAEIDEQARARSSGAVDVLQQAQSVGSLIEAVRDCGFVAGASARRRSLSWPELDARACAQRAVGSDPDKPVALVFGPEQSGLRNEHLDLCHALVFIPCNPEYRSLNLAMAVQILVYELRCAQGALNAPPESRDGPPLASADDMEHFYGHLERALLSSGFLNPDNPRHLMRRLRRLFNRAELDQNEFNILRGILAALAPGTERPGGDAGERS